MQVSDPLPIEVGGGGIVILTSESCWEDEIINKNCLVFCSTQSILFPLFFMRMGKLSHSLRIVGPIM